MLQERYGEMRRKEGWEERRPDGWGTERSRGVCVCVARLGQIHMRCERRSLAIWLAAAVVPPGEATRFLSANCGLPASPDEIVVLE